MVGIGFGAHGFEFIDVLSSIDTSANQDVDTKTLPTPQMSFNLYLPRSAIYFHASSFTGRSFLLDIHPNSTYRLEGQSRH